jgi:siroheme synthase
MKGWDAMPEFYLIQWGVIGVFVLIHFLIGFLRGSSKSTYFTIVSLVLTVVTLWLVSKISLNLLFSTFLSLETLIATIQNLSGGIIPEEFIEYILNPTISAVIIAVIDLVIKIVAFILIYPFLKWSLTMTIFRPIWVAFIKKPLIKKQNEKDKLAFEKKGQKNRKFKPSKKLKKPILGRLLGGFMGAIRGFVVGVVFLLPVIVLAGFVSGIASNLSYNEDGTFQLSSDANEMISIPGEYNEIIDNIIRMNENGIGRLTSQIVISGKSIDRIAFDMIFSADIIEDGEKVGEINLGNELEGIVGIAEVLIRGQYLDNYDFNQLSSDNLPDIEIIMGHLGRSTLIQSMIPLGTKFAVINLLPPLINGTNLYDRESTKEALDNFTSIDWEVEFQNIYGIIEAILEFGSYQELMEYANNPLLLLDMTPEEAESFTDIIRAFGQLETLYLLNAGIDFATSYQSVQNIVSWVNQEDREAYLQERLSFILDHPDFFVGDSGEIARIADLIQSIFADETVSVKALYEASGNLEEFIALQNPTWVGGLLDQLVQIELLVKTIPLGVDYALYQAFGDQIAIDMANQISEALSETSWDDEILNIGNIYKEALSIGIGAIFGDNPNYFAFIDDVAVNHMDSIRTIIEHIFEDSEVVNVAIEYASPFLIEQFISDQALRDLVLQGLMSDPDSGVVDFSFGQELNNILTMVETVYIFTTTEELANIASMELVDQLDFVSRFGSLTEVQFSRFDTAIKDMQLLSRLGKDALTYVQSTSNIEQLYIPEQVSLGDDLSSLFNFVYYAANYLYQESLTTPFIEDVDFAPLLADPLFKSYLLPTSTNHSDFLISNIAHNIMLFSSDASLQDYLTIPASLQTASPEDQVWKDEIANLFGAVFDLGAFFEGSNTLKLSVREMVKLSEDPYQAPISLITQFADSDMTKATEAFGNLDSSLIFRHSISTVIESLGTQSLGFIEGFELGMPDVALEEGVIKENMFVELIWGISTLLDDANQTLNFNVVADLINNQDNYLYIQALNNVSDDTYLIFSSITLLRGIISEILLDTSVQAYARDMVNNTGFVTVSDQFLAFERPDNLLDPTDIAGLFISAKSLQITAPFYYNPGQEVYGFINQLSNVQLDGFFDATLIKEIFTFALTDELLVESLATRVNDIYYNAQSGIGLLAQINPDFTGFVASLGAQRDEDNYFDVGELKALIQAFQELDVTSAADLSALGDLTIANQKIANSLVIEKLFESNWLYTNLNYVFTNEALYEQLADILEQQIFSQTGVNHELTGENVSFVLPKYDMLETAGDRVGMIKVSEFKKFLIAGTRVNWIGAELGSGAGIATNVANLLLEEGEDGQRHVDVLVESNLIVAIFDKLLNFEYNGFGIDQILVDFGNARLGSIAALDGLTLTKEILHYDTTAYDANEVIKREEIAQLFESLTVLDLNQPINLQAFITLVDEGKLPDLLASKILHSFISNALTNENVQQFGVDKVNGIQTILVLPNDFFAVDPVLLDGDLFKVTELENIFIALRALGLESGNFGAINQDTFIALVDPATIDGEGKDDFDRVFGANYIYILLDRAIALEGFSDFAVQTLGLDALSGDPISLNPPQSIKLNDPMNPLENGRLPKIEFRRLLTSVNMLGDLAQFSDPAVLIDVLTGMIGDDVDPDTNEDDFDRFMSSDYLYYMISVLLQNQDQISVPVQALEIGGMYDGFIKKAEIRAVLNALIILEIFNPNDIQPEDITIQKLIDILDLEDSAFVQYLISQQIISALDPDNEGKIPDDAFEGDPEDGMLTMDEIRAIADALVILANNDPDTPITDIAFDQITVGQVQELSTVPSIVIKQLLTDEIKKALDPDDEGKIPADAYENNDPNGRLSQDEIDALVVALLVLANNDPDLLITDISTDVTVGQAIELRDGTGTPGETVGLDSLIIQQIMSDEIINLLGADNIPDSAYTDLTQSRLIRLELEEMIQAIYILADGNLLLPVADLSVDAVTVGQVADLNDLNSEITKKLISQTIIDNIDADMPEGESRVPLDAYSIEDLTRLSDTELDAMIEALLIIANNDDTQVVSSLNFSEINVGQVQELSTVNSYIIKQVLTDEIKKNLDPDDEGKVPVDAYENDDPTGRLKQAEIDAMVVALLVLANQDPDILITDISTDVTVGQALELRDGTGTPGETVGLDSLIIQQIMSDEIINLLGADNIPSSSYTDVTETRLLRIELEEMIEAIYILADGNTALLVADLETDDITVGQVADLNDLNSNITKKLISQTIIDNIDADMPEGESRVPAEAYSIDDPTRLSDDELDGMIEALLIIAKGDETEIVSTLNFSDISVGQVDELSVVDSYIIKQVLTDEIKKNLDPDDEGKVPVDAYENNDPTGRLKQEEIDAMVVALYVLANQDPDILITDISTDVTVGQALELRDGTGTPGEIVGLDSLIIQQIMSDEIVTILGTDNIPSSSYTDVTETRLLRSELEEMIEALNILSGGNTALLVADIDTDNVTVGQVQELNDLDSNITKRLISTAIIDNIDADMPVGESRVPLEAYSLDDPERLSDEELDAMIVALLVLANHNPSVLVKNVDTDVTVGQAAELRDGTGTPGEVLGVDSYIIQQLISEQVITVIGVDNIPDDSYADVEKTRLIKSEVINMITAIEILGNYDEDLEVSMIDADDVTVGQAKELNQLNSPITKKLISSSIIDAIDPDDEGKIPLEAYEGDPADRLLTDDERNAMIVALEILAEHDLTTLVREISTIVTVGQVQEFKEGTGDPLEVRAIHAYTIKQLISDEVEGVITTIPDDAYNNPLTRDRLTDDEIEKMIDALVILSGNDLTKLVSEIDPDLVTIGQVEELNGLDSIITNKLISDSIIDAIDPDDEGKVPASAHIDDNPANNLKPGEVIEMIEALRILAGKKTGDPNNLTDDIVVSGILVDPTIYQVNAMNDLNSEITKKLISDSIIDAIDPDDEGKIPASAHIDDNPANNLKPGEVIEMIEALRILAGKKTGDPNNLTDDIVVSGILVDPTIGQVKLLNGLDSRITEKLISDSIIDAVGVGSVPIDAYIDDTPGNLLKPGEVTNMILALEILGDDGDPMTDTDDVKLVDIDTRVTVAQTQDLKTNGSVIIKQIISDAITDMLAPEQIPNDAYRTEVGLNRLKDSEIEAMIDSLEILAGGDDSVYVDEIVFDESTFTVTTLKLFPDSLIMNRIISSGLISNMPNIPIESYIDRDPLDDEYKLDLLRIEINNILDALTILGIDDPNDGDSISADAITFAQLDEIILLGTVGSLNEHPEGYSPIIVHILSTPMREAVSRVVGGFDYGVPMAARRNEIDTLTYDLIYEEVVGLIDALKLIGNVGEDPGQEDPETTSLFDVSSTLDPESFGPDLLDDLIGLDKLVVYRMISLGIQDADIDNDDSYALVGDRNYDPDLPGAPVYRDIKIAEMEHLVQSMDILGITSVADVATQITVAKLKALTPAEVEVLVEAGSNGPNTIIYYIISETVDPDNDLFDTLVILDPINYPGPADDYYVIDVVRIRLKRTSISDAINALP